MKLILFKIDFQVKRLILEWYFFPIESKFVIEFSVIFFNSTFFLNYSQMEIESELILPNNN